MLALSICLFFMSVPAYAALQLELTQGVAGAIPLAIVPFTKQSAALPTDVSKVIRDDLANSGRFNVLPAAELRQFPHNLLAINYNYWRKLNVNDVLIGTVKKITSNRYAISFALIDVYRNQTNDDNKNQVLVARKFEVDAAGMRHLAHHISDVVFEQLTGQRGVFNTRIAYIVVQRYLNKPVKYSLEVADADGYNPRPILVSPQPIMSPAWSPDGKSMAYVSFEHKHAQIYIADLATGKRTLVANYPGINGAPAWSPDGNKLAIVLSKSGNPNIYLKNLQTGKLRQLTHGLAINTEPSWSPDGSSIIFTSNRGGGPQIYRFNLADDQVTRLTFAGNYNARASYAPDGKSIVMLHRQGGLFNIAIQDLASGVIKTLTTDGLDESPSMAPNGDLILYASQYGGRGVLGVVSTDGRVKIRLPAREGNVQEPAWSPYLS